MVRVLPFPERTPFPASFNANTPTRSNEPLNEVNH